jgi:hypothetical protein
MSDRRRETAGRSRATAGARRCRDGRHSGKAIAKRKARTRSRRAFRNAGEHTPPPVRGSGQAQKSLSSHRSGLIGESRFIRLETPMGRLGMAFVVVLTCAVPASAADLPARKAGLWEMTTTAFDLEAILGY